MNIFDMLNFNRSDDEKSNDWNSANIKKREDSHKRITAFLQKPKTVNDIADHFGLNVNYLGKKVRQWESLGIIEFAGKTKPVKRQKPAFLWVAKK